MFLAGSADSLDEMAMARERERHMSAHMFLVDFDGIDGRMALMHSDCLCFRLAND